MFQLETGREFDWPIEVRLPDGVEENGSPRWKHARFTARFRSVSIEPGKVSAAAESLAMDYVLLGWTDVLDEEDRPLEVTDENKRRLLAEPGVAAALYEAYIDALVGGRARKN